MLISPASTWTLCWFQTLMKPKWAAVPNITREQHRFLLECPTLQKLCSWSVCVWFSLGEEEFFPERCTDMAHPEALESSQWWGWRAPRVMLILPLGTSINRKYPRDLCLFSFSWKYRIWRVFFPTDPAHALREMLHEQVQIQAIIFCESVEVRALLI